MAHEIVTPPTKFAYGIVTGTSADLDAFCQRVIDAVANGYDLWGPTRETFWKILEVRDDEGVIQRVPVILYSQTVIVVPRPKPQISQAIQLPGIMKPPGGNLN